MTGLLRLSAALGAGYAPEMSYDTPTKLGRALGSTESARSFRVARALLEKFIAKPNALSNGQ